MSKVPPPETDPSHEQTAAPEQAVQPASPPKSQLRRRVDARIAELEAELARLDDDPAKRTKISAIRQALKGAHDSMNLDSAHTGHMQAGTMTRWLASTQYLVSTKP